MQIACFYRPYKGLKLKIRNELSLWHRSFYRPYKGLKLLHNYTHNVFLISFYRPYKGLKQIVAFGKNATNNWFLSSL